MIRPFRSRLKTLAAVLGLAAFLVPAAHAGTATATLNVSLTTTATCTISAGSAVAFGTHSIFEGPSVLRQPTTLTLRCPTGTAYTLSAGAPSGQAFAISGVNHYAWLYKDAGYATELNGASTLTGVAADSNPFNVNLYLQLSGAPSAVTAPTANGNFTGSRTVTLSF